MLQFTDKEFRFLKDGWTVEAKALIGGKAFNLGELTKQKFQVPTWFVVTTDAFSISTDGQPNLASIDELAVSIQQKLADLKLHQTVRAELAQALAYFPKDTLFAVRSSAADEDSAVSSFAGQLDSFLCIKSEDVENKIVDVWRSAFSEHIITYRKLHSSNHTIVPPAVIIQAMVSADKAGVAFSIDPISGASVCVINSLFGLGESLVSGDSDADNYRVDDTGTVVSVAGHKSVVRTQSEQSMIVQQLDEPDTRLSLTEDEARGLASLVKKVAEHFKKPQDIEWAIAGDELFLLQARPITTIVQKAERKGQLYIWDNSNIGESYHGITTPLTFSFARKAYEHVYIEFCRLMGVSESTITANQNIFPNMLGFIQGRIYYNLLNWYRLIAIFPGYKVNRAFMEQMMGVREPLPKEVVPKAVTYSNTEQIINQYNFIRSLLTICTRFVFLPQNILRFNQRFEKALGETGSNLPDLTLDELSANYRMLEARLLCKWDAPLINDFFAMIFFGSLRSLTERLCNDTDGTLQNSLIAGEGGIISAEPPKLTAQAASLAAQDTNLVEVLLKGDVATIKLEMTKYPEFEKAVNQYLTKFGGRCIGELKLESWSLNDDPISFFRTIGQLASNKIKGQAELGHNDNLLNIRRDAEASVKKCLKGNLIKGCLFNWVLKNTRILVKQRENLRFERTRLFARVREIVLAIASKLSNEGIIDEMRDVFYLEVEELLGYIEGTSTNTNLNELIALRKKESDTFRILPQPADRIQTYGPIYLARNGNLYSKSHAPAINNEKVLKGTGCCRGKVKGKVRVILDPKEAAPLNGDILVARRTDPGWIIVFPQASGILVEHGSLLSHSAIVARELGIPAIVGIPGLIGQLKDGDLVEFDGSTGIINKLDEKSA